MVKAELKVYNLFFKFKTHLDRYNRTKFLGTFSSLRAATKGINYYAGLPREYILSLKSFIPRFSAEEINLAISDGFQRFNSTKLTINGEFHCNDSLTIILDNEHSIEFKIVPTILNKKKDGSYIC